MTTTPQYVTEPGSDAMASSARDHLWMHFTRHSSYYEGGHVPVIVKGDGPYIWDDQGKRYFDGLSGLFVVQVGHGRRDLALAGAKQAEELAFFPIWSYAHPRAIELAERLAHLAPVISRAIAYHGTPQGALSITGIPEAKIPFEPLVPGGIKVPNTNFYRAGEEYRHDEKAFGLWAADRIAEAIEFEGPDSVAAVFVEPVQNSGGCFPPPPGYLERVREICDRYDVLMVADETITGFGRIGDIFAMNRFGVTPDIITCAKGMSSGYAAIGAMIASERLFEPFKHGSTAFLHGYTWGGHPVAAAVALANLDLFESEGIIQNVLANEANFKRTLDKLSDLPIVGDVRGAGYFYGIELVKDKVTRETFDDDEAERLLRGFLSKALFDNGLYCRADDRGDPVVQLAPPLTCGQKEFDEMEAILRTVLTEAWSVL